MLSQPGTDESSTKCKDYSFCPDPSLTMHYDKQGVMVLLLIIQSRILNEIN